MKIPVATIRQAKAASLAVMPDRVTVLLAGEEIPDGRGGVTREWTDGETVPCRWRGKKGQLDQVVAGRAGNREVFEFVLPPETVLAETSRLRQGEITYEIVSAVSGNSFDLVQRVLACRV